MANIVKKELTEEIIEITQSSFSYFGMYFNSWADSCHEVDDYLVIIMRRSMDVDGGGGTEISSGIQVRNRETKELLGGTVWLKPYRDRYSPSDDDYSRHIVGVMDLRFTDNTFSVLCNTDRLHCTVSVPVNPAKNPENLR